MVKECLGDGRLTEDFHCVSKEKDLYEYVTLSDIEKINEAVSLQREKIIAPDGAANYMRPVLKEMDEETFELFVRYQMSVAERMDLMGASAHTVDNFACIVKQIKIRCKIDYAISNCRL